MPDFSGYTSVEPLGEGSTTSAYRAVRDSDGRRVILKAARVDAELEPVVERLRREYEVLRTLADVPGVVHALALDVARRQGPLLVMEDFAGVPVQRAYGRKLSVDDFWDVATQLCQALAAVHAHKIIHRDVNPSNVLVDPSNRELKLVDFGIASHFPVLADDVLDDAWIEGTLPYIAPEQTGRIHAALGPTTDLYSLGVTFYELLTGRTPFQSSDPLELVHLHLTKLPMPPIAHMPELPQALSDVILKLLAKLPEERYMSALGLLRDIEICAGEWRRHRRVRAFTLAQRDASEELQIPARLYGRGRALGELVEAYGEASKDTRLHCAIVFGPSGLGKSALLGALRESVARDPRHMGAPRFVSGKFDQYATASPHVTIAGAFRPLIKAILSAGETDLRAWSARFVDGLGDRAGLLHELIPELEFLVPMEPVLGVSGLEAKHRFQRTFASFVHALTEPERPLVLCMDDLQWADEASLELLEYLVGPSGPKHLFLVLALRCEVDELDGNTLVRAIRGSGAKLHEVPIHPLSSEDLRSLIADTLHEGRSKVAELAELVHAKTAGNPFFVRQFLETLHRDGLLSFDGGVGWTWDVARIQGQALTDNVADLVITRLGRLPSAAQRVLGLAACLGNRVEAATLAVVCEIDEDQLQSELASALREGLLLGRRGEYVFLHDRVQQAAYLSIPEAERGPTHLRIGRLLLMHLGSSLAERVFEVVNHLNIASDLIAEPAERANLVALNLDAGIRAARSAAFPLAAHYFSQGVSLLPSDAWQEQYELAFALCVERAECLFTLGQPERAEELATEALEHARTDVEAARAYSTLAKLYSFLGRNEEACRVGVQCLARLGVDVALRPSQERVLEKYTEIWRILGEREIESLVDLPKAHRPNLEIVTDMLVIMSPAALYFDQNLLCLLECLLVELSLRHGHTRGSAIGYVAFGMLLGSAFKRYDEGYRFGKLACELVEHRGLSLYAARVEFCFGALIHPWTRGVRAVRSMLDHTLQVALNAGEHTISCNCYAVFGSLGLFESLPLDGVFAESERSLDLLRRGKFQPGVDGVIAQQRLMLSLLGRTDHLATYADPSFDEAGYEAEIEARAIPMALAWYYIRKTQARVIAGDYAAAVRAGSRADELAWTTSGFIEQAEHRLHYALALAGEWDTATPERRQECLQTLREQHAELGILAESCPGDFDCRYALVSAEVERLSGNPDAAARHYERAVTQARVAGFVAVEALACELAARFYRERGLFSIERLLLRQALDGYARWKAVGKVRQLERRYPELARAKSPSFSSTFNLPVDALDTASIFKVSQSISNEPERPKLVEALLRLTIEQASAERACLLTVDDRDLVVTAEISSRDDSGPIWSSRLLQSVQGLPTAVLEYVKRTRERCVLGDAGSIELFANDAYIRQHEPKSAICLPIVHQAALVGILYLENQLVPATLSASRLAALELLCGQVAIALDNARLYDELCRERDLLSLVMDTSPVGIVVTNRMGEVFFANRYGAELFGLRKEGGSLGTVRRTWRALELLDEDGRPLADADAPFAQVVATNAPVYGLRVAIETSHAGRRQLLANAAPWSGDEEYGEHGVVAVFQDVTGEVQAEIERKLLEERLIVSDRLQSMGVLAAGICHELNNPLTFMICNVDLLELDLAKLEPEGTNDIQATTEHLQGARERLETIREGVDRITSIVQDVMMLSRGDEVQLSPVDLQQVIDVATKMALQQIRPRARLTAEFGELPRVEASASRLGQVFLNLLVNAAHAIQEGKPAEHQVQIVTRTDADGWAVVEIHDTGAGIPPAVRARIFEPFFTTKPAGLGTGLGLAICRSIVTGFGGDIEVESELGTGSVFRVRLPPYIVNGHHPKPGERSPSTPPGP